MPTTASRPATPQEIVELKRIYASFVRSFAAHEHTSWRPQSVEGLREAAQQDDDRPLRWYAIRRLTFYDDAATQAVLTHLVRTGELKQRFYAAGALAYQGRSEGVEVLQEALSGSTYLSASGYEISEAGMALAILGHQLPPSFAMRVNPFFSILDRLFE